LNAQVKGSIPFSWRCSFILTMHSSQTGSFVPVTALVDGTVCGLNPNTLLQQMQLPIAIAYPIASFLLGSSNAQDFGPASISILGALIAPGACRPGATHLLLFIATRMHNLVAVSMCCATFGFLAICYCCMRVTIAIGFAGYCCARMNNKWRENKDDC
jgi:hypothetical protein